MQIEFKVNTGTVKTGKHLLSRFNDEDVKQLNNLENNIPELFNNLMTCKIKNTFGGLKDIRERVDFSVLKKQGIKNYSYDKKVRGFFITYLFTVS